MFNLTNQTFGTGNGEYYTKLPFNSILKNLNSINKNELQNEKEIKNTTECLR
jgi:hypothetical protein